MKISVCMATYNGEKHIEKQLETILGQLGDNDELIISDDSSIDHTVSIIKKFVDDKIKLYPNQNFKSPIYNFENSIKHASGDIIVLSDQDDIWNENKLEVIRKKFMDESMSFKMFNGNCINDKDIEVESNLFKYLGVKEGFVQNIMKNSFIGCNIAFSADLLKVVLPFPKDIPMHDSWIALCSYMFGNVKFINENVFSYRLHNNNFTNRQVSPFQKVLWRYQLIKNLLLRRIKIALS